MCLSTVGCMFCFSRIYSMFSGGWYSATAKSGLKFLLLFNRLYQGGEHLTLLLSSFFHFSACKVFEKCLLILYTGFVFMGYITYCLFLLIKFNCRFLQNDINVLVLHLIFLLCFKLFKNYSYEGILSTESFHHQKILYF